MNSALPFPRNIWRSWTKKKQAEFILTLSDAERSIFHYTWEYHARDEQLPPKSDWLYFLILAGRGFGKTRTLSEWIRGKKNICGRIALVAETAADGRDVVVDGESGLIACSPPWDRPIYEPSKRRISWGNGAYATLYSGEDPEQLRGPQHSAAAIDELCKYRYGQELWDQLKFGLRIPPTDGSPPQALIATTPKPTPLIKKIIAHPRCITVVRSTYDNIDNLAPEFIQELRDTYEGTTLGQQEIHAAILDEARGALWTRAMIENTRVHKEPGADYWKRTVIGVDPQTVARRGTTGIVGASLGQDNHGYIRGDASGGLSPNDWAGRAVQMYFDLEADTIVAEGNQGGDMVRQTIESHCKDKRIIGVNVKVVWARHGKQARAEPVVARYEQGRVHHVGTFAMLEAQMVTWEPESGQASPDRLDALVWACTELLIKAPKPQAIAGPYLVP